MSVSLDILVQTSPFSPEAKQDLLKRVGKNQLNESQKFELAETCWTALAQQYFALLKYKQDKILLDISQGKRKPNKNDFEKATEKLTQKFAKKLQSAETEEEIEGVRSKLKQFLKRPLSPRTA